MTETNDEYLTTAEAVKLCKVHRVTLNKWRRQKGLPYGKRHGRVVYRRSDLEKLIRWSN